MADWALSNGLRLHPSLPNYLCDVCVRKVHEMDAHPLDAAGRGCGPLQVGTL